MLYRLRYWNPLVTVELYNKYDIVEFSDCDKPFSLHILMYVHVVVALPEQRM